MEMQLSRNTIEVDYDRTNGFNIITSIEMNGQVPDIFAKGFEDCVYLGIRRKDEKGLMVIHANAALTNVGTSLEFDTDLLKYRFCCQISKGLSRLIGTEPENYSDNIQSIQEQIEPIGIIGGYYLLVDKFKEYFKNGMYYSAGIHLNLPALDFKKVIYHDSKGLNFATKDILTGVKGDLIVASTKGSKTTYKYY